LKRSEQIFLTTFLGMLCFFTSLYFLERSMILLSILSISVKTPEFYQNEELYKLSLFLFGGFVFLSSMFLALTMWLWITYDDVEREIEKTKEELKKEKEDMITFTKEEEK